MNAAPLPVLTESLSREFRSFRRRDRVQALNGLDLEVRPGEVVALLGPNGSGKSTTMKLLLGLLRPSSGRARLFGKTAGHRETLRRVGYLPEESRLFSFLTARETLIFFGGLAGLTRRERRTTADRLLAEVGLKAVARRRTGGFSKGMTRRLGLAAALVGEPELLLLDEPTSGLDPLAAEAVKRRIRASRDQGVSVLLSSHLLSDVQDLSDRVVILGRGQVIREGPAEDLLTLKKEWVVRFKGGAPGFPERVAEFVRDGGGEAVEVAHPREDLSRLFLRLFGES